MDSFTRGSLTLAVCLAASVSIVAGLQCYSCNYFKLQTSDETVNNVLASILSGSQEECMGSVNKDSKGVDLQDCPTPGTGKKSLCRKVDATVDMSVLFKYFTYTTAASIMAGGNPGQCAVCRRTFPEDDIKMDIVMRGCAEEASDKNDGCEKPSDEDKNKFKGLFSLATISALDGTSCTCSGELCNGQQKVTAQTLCWLAGLLLAFCAHFLW